MNAAAGSIPSAKGQRLRWPIVWTVIVGAVLLWGYHAHLERYISPQRGLGYALGIMGGSMMLLLLIYSARKRAAWLNWMGGIPLWFEIHMVLGIAGPVLVLFHSNFKLGATNSNVALFCMLLVAGSGIVGRYIYTRLHARMDGHEQSLEQLRAIGGRLRTQSGAVSFLPGVLDAIDRAEQELILPPKNVFARFPHLLGGGVRIALARWRVRREIRRAVAAATSSDSALIASHAQRIGAVAHGYADRRLEACRRVAEYQLYSRLFSFWHVLHVPLFFMLLIAGIVHVIAINVY